MNELSLNRTVFDAFQTSARSVLSTRKQTRFRKRPMIVCDTPIYISQELDVENEKQSVSASPEPAIRELQEAFRAGLTLPHSLEPRLHAALTHVLENPGSMVRPRLVYQTATAFGMGRQPALDLGIALEYFHTASLIFDDLPCMDDALSRRGAPCVHVPFGDATAILGALALINRAYGLTWNAIADTPANARSIALEYMEQRLGVHGLLNGQSLDLNYASLPHNRRTTEKVAHGKTVALIRLTLVFPAMLGGASHRELQLLERIALFWGLGYQIVDDLKDVLQSSAESGKTAARDFELNRPNIALAIGIGPAVDRLTRLIDAGDATFARLLAVRPAMSFLGRLRNDLQSELIRVTNTASGGAGL